MNYLRLLILSLFLLVTASLFAEETTEAAAAPKASAYPIDYCLVSGEKLGGMGDPVSYMHEGREIQFCCANCIASFEQEPAKYLAQLDKAIIEKQSASYPLSTCVVSGEELGGMGDPVDMVYNNELVRFCCSGCKKDFSKNPGKYMEMIHAARRSQMMEGDMDAMHNPAEKPEGGNSHHEDHEGHGH